MPVVYSSGLPNDSSLSKLDHVRREENVLNTMIETGDNRNGHEGFIEPKRHITAGPYDADSR